MQAADLKRKKKRRRTNRDKVNGDSKSKSLSERRKDNDPLQSFTGDLDDLGIEGGQDEDDFEDPLDEGNDNTAVELSTAKKLDDSDTSKSKAVLSTRNGTVRITSVRNAWKEKRRKVKFNQRKIKNKNR